MNSLQSAFAALGLVLTTLISGASADVYHHIEEVTHEIASQAGHLVSEVRHYRQIPEYRHLLNDAREMRNLAEHMHDLAHRHGSLAHLEHDLRELDHTFHHLATLFDRVERNARCGRYGQIRGNTDHVRQLLHAIEDNIHFLQDDLRTLRRAGCRPKTPYAVGRPPLPIGSPYFAGPQIPSPYSRVPSPYSRGNSFSIGGGSSRITFRF